MLACWKMTWLEILGRFSEGQRAFSVQKDFSRWSDLPQGTISHSLRSTLSKACNSVLGAESPLAWLDPNLSLVLFVPFWVLASMDHPQCDSVPEVLTLSAPGSFSWLPGLVATRSLAHERSSREFVDTGPLGSFGRSLAPLVSGWFLGDTVGVCSGGSPADHLARIHLGSLFEIRAIEFKSKTTLKKKELYSPLRIYRRESESMKSSLPVPTDWSVLWYQGGIVTLITANNVWNSTYNRRDHTEICLLGLTHRIHLQ